MVNVPGGDPINAFIAALRSDDSAERRFARENLVEMGAAVVPALTAATSDPDAHVRWEATAALLELAEPSAAPALVRALDDETIAVRWLASEALIRLEDQALPFVLKGLILNTNSPNFREGAERVLRHVSDGPRSEHADLMRPVIDAMDKPAPGEVVPTAALQALDGLRARGVPIPRDDEEISGERAA